MLSSVITALIILFLPSMIANTYTTNFGFTLSKSVYQTNERIELVGNLYVSNFSVNGTLLQNDTALQNTSFTLSIINKSNNNAITNYTLTTNGTPGVYYTKSDYHPTATLVNAPSSPGTYFIKVYYTDQNSTNWTSFVEFSTILQIADILKIRADKISYDTDEAMNITLEATRTVGTEVAFTANVTLNGSVQDLSRNIIRTFNCTTGADGTCTITTTAPSSYGTYYLETKNFQGISLINVVPFTANTYMKDSLGKTYKNVFSTTEQAIVEVQVLTNSSNEYYSYNGTVTNINGAVLTNITNTEASFNNSYIGQFPFTITSSFSPGSYIVAISINKSNGRKIESTTYFEVRDWSFTTKKRDLLSGFEQKYDSFPSKPVYFELVPQWRSNATVITDVNVSNALNVTLTNKLGDVLALSNASYNASCGKNGCYEFSLTTPNMTGQYLLKSTVTYSNDVQTQTLLLNVVNTTISAQSVDKEGTIKELFGNNEPIYLQLSAKFSSGNAVNLTSAEITKVTREDGIDQNYTQVSTVTNVNSSNSALEWAFNVSNQMLKLDAPPNGGMYTVSIFGENKTIATSAKFIINPYDVCTVAKNTAGSVTSQTGTTYYYVYQFKTSDTIYFELRLKQANNPTGKATVSNSTNSSYGKGSACSIDTSTQQPVNNATITVSEVKNVQTEETISMNSSTTTCASDDASGGYTCTLQPASNWKGGSYTAKFEITSQDGLTHDTAYGNFDARAFYVYAWSPTYQNKPTANITLNAYMYEAGNSWWGNYGSGGLSGSLTVQKIEYMGSDGEWLWPPISVNYNTSVLNTTSITNGQGTILLPVRGNSAGTWKTGNYRAVLKGVDSSGNVDYGYAWFSIKRWDVYANPVTCSSATSCSYANYVNVKSNVTLYVRITNAGDWNDNGNTDLGENVTIKVKKIQDCKKYPCKELNNSEFTSTNLTLTKSTPNYWAGTTNSSYTINLTSTSGIWNSGWYSLVIDVNGTETGYGYFNAISFFVDTQPTDLTGTQYKYNIRPSQPLYFKITTTKLQKYGTYASGDYVLANLTDATIRTWDQSTNQQIQYNYPADFNVSPIIINGTRVVNLNKTTGNWPTGYYYGDVTLKDNESQTATGYLWFNIQSFRANINVASYSIDSDSCNSGTISIYDPDWYSNTLLTGNYSIMSASEYLYTGSSSTRVTYTNITPSTTFNGTANFTICPNNGNWGSGSWGGYHYLTVKIRDNSGNSTQDGWLSFKTVPYLITWGSVVGGTNKAITQNIQVPVTLSKPSGGSTAGNLSYFYQWNCDGSCVYTRYNFTVGNCNGGTNSGLCSINGTQTITILAPAEGWKEGYNYLYAVFVSGGNELQDYNGVYFNAANAYQGLWNSVDANGNWKYDFGFSENITARLSVMNVSGTSETVTLTKVEYGTAPNCWSDYCRTWSTANWTIIGGGTTINNNAIIKMYRPDGSNWTKGYYGIRATVTGIQGTVVLKNGFANVKDTTPPNITLLIPAHNSKINTSTYLINFTTTENSKCSINLVNYASLNSWYCYTSSSAPPSQMCSNNTYIGNSYSTEYISDTYYSHYTNNASSYSYGSTGMLTGGLVHTYNASTAGYITQNYGLRVQCYDDDYNYAYAHAIVNITGS